MDDWGAGLLGPGDDLSARLERWAAEARVDDAARQRTRERWLRQQAEEGATLVGVLCDLAERGTPVALRTRAGRQHRGVIGAVGEDFVAVAPEPSASPPPAGSAHRGSPGLGSVGSPRRGSPGLGSVGSPRRGSPGSGSVGSPGLGPSGAGAAEASGMGSSDLGRAAFVALDAVSSVRVMPGSAAVPTGDRSVRTRLRLAEVLVGLAAERDRVLVVARGPDDAVAGSLRSVGLDVAVVRLDGPEPATAYVPLAAVAELVLDA